MPDAASASAVSARNAPARRSGSSVVICNPTWTCIATRRSDGRLAIDPASSRAASAGTPNLLILRPVEMCGWLRASMSGLIRIATRAVTPVRAAIDSTRASSPADSTLIARNPSGTAHSSSVSDLPTPVKTMSAASKPARRARSISQIELASTAPPIAFSSRTRANVEFALSA